MNSKTLMTDDSCLGKMTALKATLIIGHKRKENISLIIKDFTT